MVEVAGTLGTGDVSVLLAGGVFGAERIHGCRPWSIPSGCSSESKNVLNHSQLANSESTSTGPRALPIVLGYIPGSSEYLLDLNHRHSDNWGELKSSLIWFCKFFLCLLPSSYLRVLYRIIWGQDCYPVWLVAFTSSEWFNVSFFCKPGSFQPPARHRQAPSHCSPIAILRAEYCFHPHFTDMDIWFRKLKLLPNALTATKGQSHIFQLGSVWLQSLWFLTPRYRTSRRFSKGSSSDHISADICEIELLLHSPHRGHALE